MQKSAVAAAVLLALLSGCDSRKNEVAAPAVAGLPKAAEVSAAPPAPLPGKPHGARDMASGEKVYRSTCTICHRIGLKGAPRLGDRKEWEARLAQGRDVLYDRAIHGYRGSKGSMPARGSNVRLSDDEVRAAVDYMVWHSVPASPGSFGSHVFSAATKRSTIRQP